MRGIDQFIREEKPLDLCNKRYKPQVIVLTIWKQTTFFSNANLFLSYFFFLIEMLNLTVFISIGFRCDHECTALG